ncbi:DUF1003 domain-containing protein [Candidatus Pacearchaeota archaeon]|nr:DUF1003 domain-containing protein [Candidatus Pacearchaeota archaeon]
MKKKGVKKEIHFPIIGSSRTFGQRSSDWTSKWIGSWTFIISFLVLLGLWMYVNINFLIQYKLGTPWDPYPFILLNLVLSCLAAIQAPIILMSQNRQTQRDRIKAENDYRINKKAEKEIQEIKKLLMKRNKK